MSDFKLDSGDGPRPRSPWWVRVLLPPAHREEILGDLAEWSVAHGDTERNGPGEVPWQSIVKAAFEARILTLRFRMREVRENEKGKGRMTMGTMMQDLRFATRTLRKAPGFTAVAVATLSLGLGATGAMITVVDSVLLKPLAYGNPDQLVHLDGMRGEEFHGGNVTYPDIEDVETLATTLQGVFAFQGWQPALEQADGTLALSAGASVSGNYFGVLGVEPALGRFFPSEEGELGHEPVVVLSYGHVGDAIWIGSTGSGSDHPEWQQSVHHRGGGTRFVRRPDRRDHLQRGPRGVAFAARAFQQRDGEQGVGGVLGRRATR